MLIQCRVSSNKFSTNDVDCEHSQANYQLWDVHYQIIMSYKKIFVALLFKLWGYSSGYILDKFGVGGYCCSLCVKILIYFQIKTAFAFLIGVANYHYAKDTSVLVSLTFIKISQISWRYPMSTVFSPVLQLNRLSSLVFQFLSNSCIGHWLPAVHSWSFRRNTPLLEPCASHTTLHSRKLFPCFAIKYFVFVGFNIWSNSCIRHWLPAGRSWSFRRNAPRKWPWTIGTTLLSYS